MRGTQVRPGARARGVLGDRVCQNVLRQSFVGLSRAQPGAADPTCWRARNWHRGALSLSGKADISCAGTGRNASQRRRTTTIVASRCCALHRCCARVGSGQVDCRRTQAPLSGQTAATSSAYCLVCDFFRHGSCGRSGPGGVRAPECSHWFRLAYLGGITLYHAGIANTGAGLATVPATSSSVALVVRPAPPSQ